MNEYFKRTPDSFNYDNAQQGEGNLYDLRVATRDEIKKLEDGTLHAFDQIRDANDQINFVYEVLKQRIKEIKDLERINKIQDDDIEFNHQRILDLIAAGTVDHGKYAHLTELQLNGIIGVLKVYADSVNWSSFRPRWFLCDQPYPYGLAREALRDAGLLEDGE